MRNKTILISTIFIILISAGGLWYWNNQAQASSTPEPLEATGVIEARKANLAPEVGGLVVDVLVEEGQSITTGQVLIRLDDSLLQAQLHQARTALVVAQANYDQVAAGLTEEQREAAIAAASLELIAAQQALESIYDQTDLAATQALQVVAESEKLVDDTKQHVDNLINSSDQTDIDAAHASMILAMDQLEDAQEDFEPHENKPKDNVSRAVYQAKLAQAQQIYDDTVRRYNNLVGTANKFDLAITEAKLAVYQVQLKEAQEDYVILKDGPDPDDIAVTEARIRNAQAQLSLAKMETPTVDQLAVAKAQVDTAQAQIDAVEAQLEKFTIYAPWDGIVLNRSIEPGETALPGTNLLGIGRLDFLELTVYLAEDRFGRVTPGQQAKIRVDAYPTQVFSGRVLRLANEFEFTPTNIQTKEDRVRLVYEVVLSLDNPDLALKPGMIADAEFD